MSNEKKKLNKTLICISLAVFILVIAVAIGVSSKKNASAATDTEVTAGYHQLPVGNGVLTIQDIDGLTYVNSSYLISASNSDYYITYGDSEVKTGDEVGIDSWKAKSTDAEKAYNGGYTNINGKQCYVLTPKDAGEKTSVYMLQDIGMSNLIEIRISSSTKETVQELIEKFAINTQ